jgi:cytochrome c oxidase cbb3-type subunit I
MAVQEIMKMEPSVEPQKLVHSDEAAKWWITLGLIALVTFGFFGLTTAVKFVFPGLFNGIDWLAWPRIRPAHVNGITFGWLVSVAFGLYSYIIPRLCGTNLYSESLGKKASVVWGIGIVVGTLGILNPWNTLNPWFMTKGKEWEDYDVIANVILTVGGLMMTYNLFRTIAKRRYRQIYVAMWYGMGFMMWMLFSYVIGNWPGQALDWSLGPILHTPKHFFGFVGSNDANVNWFYGHAIVGLVATPAFLGVAYYFIPKSLNVPLYSHKLSIIGFWTIATVYIWVGAHHMIYGPIPYWLQTLATIMSFLLFIPVVAAVTNFLGTMRGEWHQIGWNVPFKFLASGTVMYFLVSAQGSFMALRPLSAITHFTDFTIGHSHLALFGFATMFAYAGLYYAVPRIWKRPLYSEAIADWSFWLSFIGVTVYVTSMSIAGYYQGVLWADPSIPFIDTVTKMIPFWHARAGGGGLMVMGMILVAFNVYKTATVKGGPSLQDADAPLGATDMKLTPR